VTVEYSHNLQHISVDCLGLTDFTAKICTKLLFPITSAYIEPVFASLYY